MSRLAFTDRNVDLKDVDLEKLSLLNDGDSKKVNDIYEEGACALDPTAELVSFNLYKPVIYRYIFFTPDLTKHSIVDIKLTFDLP